MRSASHILHTVTHKQFSSKGGKAGKGSALKRAAAIKANKARWDKHREKKIRDPLAPHNL